MTRSRMQPLCTQPAPGAASHLEVSLDRQIGDEARPQTSWAVSVGTRAQRGPQLVGEAVRELGQIWAWVGGL